MTWRRALVALAAALAVTVLLLALRAWTHVPALARLGSTGDGAREGELYAPRGGPYILGYEARGEARLLVDGQVVAKGPGKQSARRIYDAGTLRIRFEGPEGAVLLWHPPGRRGPLERVPASAVRPAPGVAATATDDAATAPAPAPWGAAAGRSLGDAAILTAILLAWLAAAWWLVRPRVSRATLAVLGVVFVVALLARGVGLSAAGQTWDEDEYWSAGRNYVENVLAADFRDVAWRDNFEHPPVTKLIAGVGALWQDGMDVARALFALLSALTCVLAAVIAGRLFGGHAGLFAGVACALSPHLVGHARVIGHETPSVFFWTLAVWLALRVQDLPPEARGARVRRLVLVGVVAGLGLATRYSNVLLAPVLAVALVLFATRKTWLETLVGGALVAPAAALATFVAVWPRMWHAPVEHLREAYKKIKLPHPPEYYLGALQSKMPASYFVVYTLVVTPLVLLVLGLVGGAARALARRERGWLLVLVWILAPLGMTWVSVQKDGVRYVLPVLVPLAIAAGAGLDQLGVWLRGRVPAAALAAALALVLGVTWARTQPYHLDYYNELGGGAGEAQRAQRFEVAWWGEGIAEAVDYTNAHAQPGDTLFKLISPNHVNWFTAALWRGEVQDPLRADWLVVNDAGIFVNDVLLKAKAFQVPADAVLVHDVRVQGASLVRVYRRKGP